jgi:hypothetical protein
MAGLMAKSLDLVVGARRVEPNQVPSGVYEDARKFFELVIEATGPLPANPPASLNAYRIAADAVRGSVSPVPKDRKELREHLTAYGSFIERLTHEGPLSNLEVATAERLRKFFARLKREGQAEAYERRIMFEPPPLGNLRS